MVLVASVYRTGDFICGGSPELQIQEGLGSIGTFELCLPTLVGILIPVSGNGPRQKEKADNAHSQH